MDTYRTNIKRHAKEWHASVSTRKNQEWLIIQVVKQDAKTPGGAFFQLKGSVLDKLRSDFNTDKRERCAISVSMIPDVHQRTQDVYS